MENLPIKKGIEHILRLHRSGIWEIVGKNQYIKLTSKLLHTQIKVPLNHYSSPKKALKDALIYAKMYKKFIAEGIYHPRTEIVICKDNQENLALMVVMPELETESYSSREMTEKLGKEMVNKIRPVEDKYNLRRDSLWDDLSLSFNWGFDSKGDVYAHDLHIISFSIGSSFHEQILKIAKKMGIK